MGKLVGPPISAQDQEWIGKQRVFFHATAPLSAKHRVNVSPKSAKEFRVVNDSTVCWLDLSGSGSEIAAHVLENGRLTIMFVAFEGPPRIVRLHGRGRLVLPSDLMRGQSPSAKPQSDETTLLLRLFEEHLPGKPLHDWGFRSIVVLDVQRVTHSCGYSIPTFIYNEERPTLKNFSLNKGCEGMIEYRSKKNSFSIDGLPSIGQLERGELPSSMQFTDGYYFAEYGGGWWKQLQVWMRTLWRIGVPAGPARDILMFTSGGVLSTAVLHFLLLPWLSSDTKSMRALR